MKKIAIVGVEGSGKTVMMAAMGEQWERPDERGYFLSPENAEAFGFSKSVMAILRSGKWPSASSHDEVRHLDWSLQRRQDGNLEKIADISMLDYAGEVYRQTFGGEKREGYDSQVATLRSHVDEADVLIVLVNLSDVISGSMSNRRTRDAMWLTKSVLDYALGDKPRRPHAAIVFTQADSYREIISANGGTAATLKKYLPHVANLYDDLPIFTASAIDRTVIGSDGLPIPAPGFQSVGLRELVDWMISIGEVDKEREKIMREEMVVSRQGQDSNKRVITDNVPIVHLDVKGHKIQKKSKGWLKFFSLLLPILVFAACTGSTIAYCIWEFDYGGSCITRDTKKLLSLNRGKSEVSDSDLLSLGWRKHEDYYRKEGCDHYHSRSTLSVNRSGKVPIGEVRDLLRYYRKRDSYISSWVCGGVALFLLTIIITLRKIVYRRTRKTLLSFYLGKWTEAMDKRYFLFVKDGFMLYYHAVCYLFGFGGVAVDHAKAAKLFLLSAKRGVGEALVGLGWMAENGYGMPQSSERARQYYDEARSMGAKGVSEINVQSAEKGDAV